MFPGAAQVVSSDLGPRTPQLSSFTQVRLIHQPSQRTPGTVSHSNMKTAPSHFLTVKTKIHILCTINSSLFCSEYVLNCQFPIKLKYPFGDINKGNRYLVVAAAEKKLLQTEKSIEEKH